MKTIRWTSAFKADYKRILRSHRFPHADALVAEVAGHLVAGRPLPEKFVDHPLSGDWKGHRDCHLYPDLVVIRREETELQIAFVRMGTHSDLFG